MLPPQEIGEKLAAARQAAIEATNAETSVDAARTALAKAEQGVEGAKERAATARQDALVAVGDWLDSPIDAPQEGQAAE